MTRILLLSDLHFGLHRAALIGPLLERINDAKADLVVIAGDITQRGRSDEYALATDFLRRIVAPWIAVPGNHDVPLFNILARIMHPYRNWRRYIGPDRWPVHDAGQVRVIGVNTVDPLAWQRGFIDEARIGRIIAAMDPAMTNVIMLHHPLQQLPQVDKQLMRGAASALERLEQAGAHVTLTGHLHIWAVDPFLGRPLLQIQAGTSLCDRIDDRQDEFAILDFAGSDLTITRHIAPMSGSGFVEPVIASYSRESGVWTKRDGTVPDGNVVTISSSQDHGAMTG